MLLTRRFDHRGEMNELMALLAIHEIGKALGPGVFKFNQDLNEFNVVLQLWVNHLDVLFILLEQGPEISECLLYPLGQCPHRLRLVWTHPPENSLGRHENIVGQVVSSHALRISHRINLSQNLYEFGPLIVVFWGVHDDPAPALLSLLDGRQVFLGVNGLGNKPACICLNEH